MVCLPLSSGVGASVSGSARRITKAAAKRHYFQKGGRWEMAHQHGTLASLALSSRRLRSPLLSLALWRADEHLTAGL